MKKIISTFFIALCATAAFAQACNSGNGSFVCTPSGGPAAGGFDDMNTVPCIEKTVYYEHAIQFTMFNQFNFLGQQSVDSIEFVSIDNLPCGICWAVNQADKRYSANEDGCLKFSGTTNDPEGQYKCALALKAWINGQLSPVTVPANLVDQTGIRLFTRVKAQGGSNCPNVDTSVAANNLTASVGCPTAIKDVAGNVTELSVMPNPMNSTAEVRFSVAAAGNYTLSLTDMTGKLVMTRVLEVKTGDNVASIERNNLAEGIYFLSLSDGKNAITKRLTITQ